MEIDLGAEYVIGAQNDKLKIAVEIKSFLSPSRIKDFYAAVGQYAVYKDALESTDPDRILYLAMPVIPYTDLFEDKRIGNLFLERHDLNLLVFDPDKEEIVGWTPTL